MLAVVLGANVGITVAVQLLSFRLEHYAGIFLVVGGIFYLYLKRPTFRGSGQILLALGFILLAMQLITGAAGVAQANPDLKLFFHVTENYPWAIFIATALLTVAVQSSTASIGLGIGLAYGGLLSDAAVLPWVLGATLGIAVTGMLAGWSSLECRRLAVGNFIIKTAGALPLLLAGRSVSAWVFHFLPGTIAQQTANFNTLFNLSVGVLSLPLLGPLVHLLHFLFEAPESDPKGELQSYLDRILLQAPSLALNQATREEIRLIDQLKHMLHSIWVMLWGKNLRLLGGIELFQQRIESMEDNLANYLGQISDENLNEDDRLWKFCLVDYSHELADIATLVRRDLTDAIIRQIESRQEFTPEDRQELEVIYSQTLERTEKATCLLMSRDALKAEEFIREKEEVNLHFRHWRRTRLDRLGPASLNTTLLTDLLNCLRRVNSDLTAIAYTIARREDQSITKAASASELETEET
jgi:phosphate:Na+ symporter